MLGGDVIITLQSLSTRCDSRWRVHVRESDGAAGVTASNRDSPSTILASSLSSIALRQQNVAVVVQRATHRLAWPHLLLVPSVVLHLFRITFRAPLRPPVQALPQAREPHPVDQHPPQFALIGRVESREVALPQLDQRLLHHVLREVRVAAREDPR